MQYFFILGTNSALSIAELSAVLDLKNPNLLAADYLVADFDRELEADSLIKKLGGTIKIGRVLSRIEGGDDSRIVAKVIDLAKAKQSVVGSGKFNFGISDYGKKSFNKKDIGLKLKKYFSDHEISSRFVISREKTLSSVVVTQNKLLARGMEIVLAAQDNEVLIGESLSVQPFKDLSLRDFGRPARDDLSGMLPPKLAQIMINLAQLTHQDATILDPFCGSGTILSEASLMGFNNLFGSDISVKAIEDTRKNMSWIKELYKLDDVKFKLFVKSATSLSKFIKGESVDAVVTEPYLGPQRGKINFQSVVRELEELYSRSLSEFVKILKPGARVVMIWPLFYGERPMTPRHEGFKIMNMVPIELRHNSYIKLGSRDTIVYGRPGQKVFREIVVLDRL